MLSLNITVDQCIVEVSLFSFKLNIVHKKVVACVKDRGKVDFPV
jgi:hypothetical protein